MLMNKIIHSVLGLNVPISIAEFTFDYAFANFERLGSAHRFSIILGL